MIEGRNPFITEKSMNALPFAIVFLLPFTVIVGYLQGGWWTFTTALWSFVLVPLADLIVGINVFGKRFNAF